MVTGISSLSSNQYSKFIIPAATNVATGKQVENLPKITYSYGCYVDLDTGAIKIRKDIPNAFDAASWYVINKDGSGSYANCWVAPKNYPSGTFSSLYENINQDLQQSSKNKQKLTDEQFEQIIAKFNELVEGK